MRQADATQDEDPSNDRRHRRCGRAEPEDTAAMSWSPAQPPEILEGTPHSVEKQCSGRAEKRKQVCLKRGCPPPPRGRVAEA